MPPEPVIQNGLSNEMYLMSIYMYEITFEMQYRLYPRGGGGGTQVYMYKVYNVSSPFLGLKF